MIIGFVNASLEALVELTVVDSQAKPHLVRASIDTGYTGFLTLPTALISALGLTWIARSHGTLADGSLRVFDVYRAVVVWDGNIRLVQVEAADTEPLIGVALLHQHEVSIQVFDGGRVTISAVP